jgi:hypothetical protein
MVPHGIGSRTMIECVLVSSSGDWGAWFLPTRDIDCTLGNYYVHPAVCGADSRRLNGRPNPALVVLGAWEAHLSDASLHWQLVTRMFLALTIDLGNVIMGNLPARCYVALRGSRTY